MVKIVADNAIPWLDKLFANYGQIVRFFGREIDPEILEDADLLLTRSTVKIDKSLLENTSVKLVASATVGCDHVNQKELHELGIQFVHAPGCNANAVSEYVVSAIAWHEKKNIISFNNNLTAAVIGCGQIGSKVKEKLEILGFNVVVNDPPLEQSIKNQDNNHNGNGPESGIQLIQRCKDYRFVDLSEALQADVICMHTPLTKIDEFPTFHLIGKSELDHLNPNAILINAGRGEVINNSALLDTLVNGSQLNVVLDVWENEPSIDLELLNKVNLATPHIAGHSWRGKVMGTVMIYQQACEFFHWQPQDIDESDFNVQVSSLPLNANSDLYEIISQCYDIERETSVLRDNLAECSGSEIGKCFDLFRRNYYKRAEFFDLQIKSSDELIESLFPS